MTEPKLEPESNLEVLKGLWCINLNINKTNKTASKVEYLKNTPKKHTIL